MTSQCIREVCYTNALCEPRSFELRYLQRFFMPSTLKFPLYHGTSSAFLSSIKSHGLGARNPVATSLGVECLSRLLSIADSLLKTDNDWLFERAGIQAMCDQRVTRGNFNYRHGSTYLSPSRDTAVRYALSNSHGSELLSHCVSLIERLRAIDASATLSVSNEFPSVYALTNLKPFPVLIEIEEAQIQSLRTEQGGDAREQIARIENAPIPLRSALLQQSNFELVDAISSDRMRIFHILDGERRGFDLRYTLAPHVDA